MMRMPQALSIYCIKYNKIKNTIVVDKIYFNYLCDTHSILHEHTYLSLII